MQLAQRLYFVIPIVSLTIAVDQFTKWIAVTELKYHRPIIYLWDFFRFQYAENTGAMLGFGSDWPEAVRFWALTVLVGLFLAVLVVYLFTSKDMNRLKIVALALISGGGISNFVDRVFNDGRVVDFMNMGIGSLRTGIFNIADVFIMVGMGLLVFFGGLFHKEEEHQAASAETTGQADKLPPGQ